MLVLAYILGTMTDKPDLGGFNVSFGTLDAKYSSNMVIYIDLNGSEDEIRDHIRGEVANAVNQALGTKVQPEDVRLF